MQTRHEATSYPVETKLDDTVPVYGEVVGAGSTGRD